MTRNALPVLLVLLCCVPVLARGGRGRAVRPPQAEVSTDGDLERIVADDPKDSVGYLYTPKSLPEGEKGGLVVMLHGHGGTPKSVVLRNLAEMRGWLFLSVQGGGNEQTPQGPGHSWSTPDVMRVLALTRWTLANRPVDPEKIVLIGFSAGGTMVLATWPKEPSLYAGIITCSSPRIPEKRHEAARVVVFLGTEDQNFRGAPTVRKVFEGRKTGGSLQILEGSGHNDLPAAPYLDLALDWILREKTRGNEVKLPKAPPAATEGAFRHVMVAWTGAEGASKGLRRKKSSAKSLAGRIQKFVKAGKAWFPHEAQGHSDDRESGILGGRITREKLLAFGIDEAKFDKALSRRKEGEAAGPFESEAGWHLVVPVTEDGE